MCFVKKREPVAEREYVFGDYRFYVIGFQERGINGVCIIVVLKELLGGLGSGFEVVPVTSWNTSEIRGVVDRLRFDLRRKGIAFRTPLNEADHLSAVSEFIE